MPTRLQCVRKYLMTKKRAADRVVLHIHKPGLFVACEMWVHMHHTQIFATPTV